MTLYEINKNGYNNLPNMTNSKLQKATEDICDFLCNKKNKYFMMLNNESHYYTVYCYKDKKNPIAMAEEIVDVVKTLGKIKAIEIKEETIEFWISNNDDCKLYLFFDYDRGVIEV